MSTWSLYGCRHSGGRPSSALFLRRGESTKVTMAQAAWDLGAVSSADAGRIEKRQALEAFTGAGSPELEGDSAASGDSLPVMPHLDLSEEELAARHPSILAPARGAPAGRPARRGRRPVRTRLQDLRSRARSTSTAAAATAPHQRRRSLRRNNLSPGCNSCIECAKYSRHARRCNERTTQRRRVKLYNKRLEQRQALDASTGDEASRA